MREYEDLGYMHVIFATTCVSLIRRSFRGEGIVEATHSIQYTDDHSTAKTTFRKVCLALCKHRYVFLCLNNFFLNICFSSRTSAYMTINSIFRVEQWSISKNMLHFLLYRVTTFLFFSIFEWFLYICNY